MKKRKTSLLASLITAGAMLISPLKSSALEGIVKESIADEPITNVIVKLYEGDNLMDSVRTDENGHYVIGPNSVKNPDVNLPNNNDYDTKIFDMNGRYLYTLNNWDGITIPNLPSGSYVFNTPYGNFLRPVIEGNLKSPLQKPLVERVQNSKNTHRTSNADETYTLSVSDDGIPDFIGDYYDASIEISGNRNDLGIMRRDVELIKYYEMQDWDGDFLEYLKSTRGNTRTLIWGDYPQNYPVKVDVNAQSAQELLGDRAQSVLSDIRSALDEWNEMSGLNLFTYSNVNRDNRQVLINYNDEGMPRWEGNYVRDDDGRYRIESGDVYLPPNFQNTTLRHELGHATGWIIHPNNLKSIMHGNNIREVDYVTEDDGYVVRIFTTLKNNTLYEWYLPE